MSRVIRAAEAVRHTSYDGFLLRHAADIVAATWIWPAGRLIAWALRVHAEVLDGRGDGQ